FGLPRLDCLEPPCGSCGIEPAAASVDEWSEYFGIPAAAWPQFDDRVARFHTEKAKRFGRVAVGIARSVCGRAARRRDGRRARVFALCSPCLRRRASREPRKGGAGGDQKGTCNGR